MHSSLLLLAVAGSGLVQAQAAMSTAMLFLPGADQQPLQATIAGSVCTLSAKARKMLIIDV